MSENSFGNQAQSFKQGAMAELNETKKLINDVFSAQETIINESLNTNLNTIKSDLNAHHWKMKKAVSDYQTSSSKNLSMALNTLTDSLNAQLNNQQAAIKTNTDGLTSTITEQEQTLETVKTAHQTFMTALQQSQQDMIGKLEQSNQGFNQRLKRLACQNYLWFGIGVLTCGIAAVIAALMFTIHLKNQELQTIKTQIDSQRQTLTILTDQSKGIDLSTCRLPNGTEVICVAVDQGLGTWGNKYAAILKKE